MLLLLALSNCSLLNISASDFPDSIFPFGDSSEEFVITSIILSGATVKNDELSYTINVSHTDGIEKVVFSGSTFDEQSLEPSEETSLNIGDDIVLSYNDTYTRSNPIYNINVKLYPKKGNTIVSNFTTIAVIEGVQGVSSEWSDANNSLTLSVSDTGAGLLSIAIPITINGRPSESIYSTTANNRTSLTIDNMPEGLSSSLEITVTSTEGVSTSHWIERK